MIRFAIIFAIVANLTGCANNSPNATVTTTINPVVSVVPPTEQQLPTNAR